jgi:hypothetical protein
VREIYNKTSIDCADSRVINLSIRILIIHLHKPFAPYRVLEIDFMEVIAEVVISNDPIFLRRIEDVLIEILSDERIDAHDIKN